MLFRIILLGCAALLLFGSPVYSQADDNMSAPPEVKIAGTQLWKIHSSIVGRDYELYVNLPADYADSTKSFPVLYLTDGQWDFTLAQAIYGEQYFDGFIPNMIVVGIAWGGENPNYDSLRALDLTPTDIHQPARYGNAANFLKFIKNEAIPFIESRYRVKKDDRTLMGSSFGGLFNLYTLFTETSLFNRYVLTSPALTFDNGVIYKIEDAYAAKHTGLPVRVFMGIGGYEDVNTFQKFVDKIKRSKL